MEPSAAADSRPSDSSADDPADQTVQSTFESRPSKSVADFPAIVTVGPATSAATSELEAKLRQRMLKCEGMDVLHKPPVKRVRDKHPSPAPARLKHTVLKTNVEMRDISKVQNKVDELVRTASYQRCTKLRTQSAHSLTRGKKKTIFSSPEPNTKAVRRPRSLHQGARTPPLPPSAEGSSYVNSLGVEHIAAEVVVPKQGSQSAPEVVPEELVPGQSIPGTPRSESLRTPHSDNDDRLSFTSVTSQYEFFEPAETAVACAAFEDSFEESKSSPRMFDLEDGDGDDLDNGGHGDISVEECLLDLVNHIPPKFARRIGNLFQQLEEAKQCQRAFQEEVEVYFEADPGATPERPGPRAVASRTLEDPPTRPVEVQQRTPPAAEAAPPPRFTNCQEFKKQVEHQQQTLRERQEALEYQLRRDALSMASEARALREELEGSRQRSRSLMELGHEAEALVEANASRATGELETLCAAVAHADAKLLEVGVRLEVTELQSDRFRDKALSAETELKTLRERVEEANCQAQANEQRRDDLGVEWRSSEEAQALIRRELLNEAEQHEEAQEELAARFITVCAEAEAAISARAELEELSHELEEAVMRLQETERLKAQLQMEAASAQERDKLWAEHLRAKLAAAEADAQRRNKLWEEHLRAELSEAEASAERRCQEREEAQHEIETMRRAADEAASLHRDLQEERLEMQQLRQETRTREAMLRAEAASAIGEIEMLRRHIELSEAMLDREQLGMLACELARATEERDEACKDILQKREQVQEMRAQWAVVDGENEELRASQERFRLASRAELEMQVRMSEDESKAHATAVGMPAVLKAEVTELQEERDLLMETETEHACALIVTSDLIDRLGRMDMVVREEEALTGGAAAELKANYEERRCLEEQVVRERARVLEERERRWFAESQVNSLAAEKNELVCRLNSALQEESRNRKEEARLRGETGSLLKALSYEAQQLRDEQDRRRALKAEAVELKGSHSELEMRLEAETSLVREVRAVGSDGWWPMPLCVCGKRDVQALREELMAEREQLADHSQRVVQFEEVCRAVDAEVVAQAQVMKLKDSLRKQLCHDHKAISPSLQARTWQLEELGATIASMDTRAPALSEELKEVEEEGKMRREQLEAETSLMAMEVVTLTKGLGGRLLDGGILGLTRTPLTVHDIRFRLGAVNRTRAIHTCSQGDPSQGKVGNGSGSGSKLRGARTLDGPGRPTR